MAALCVVRHPDDVLPKGDGLLLQGRDELFGDIDHDLPAPTPSRSRPGHDGRFLRALSRAQRDSFAALLRDHTTTSAAHNKIIVTTTSAKSNPAAASVTARTPVARSKM